jgi:hypothetical protein
MRMRLLAAMFLGLLLASGKSRYVRDSDGRCHEFRPPPSGSRSPTPNSRMINLAGLPRSWQSARTLIPISY